MRTLRDVMLLGGFLAAAALAVAQPPDDERGRAPESGNADDFVARMMGFDKNQDGKLTLAEVTDERLHRLFDRADADKDKTVTSAELKALAAREQVDERRGPPGFGPPGFPPDGGPGGPRMGPPRPGEILPAMVRQRLNLSAEQEKQVADLQKEVDAKLEKILTAPQRAQLKQMRNRGPGGFGPPGRGGRPGGGGPPPRGPGESF